jgi:hypothetical protein
MNLNDPELLRLTSEIKDATAYKNKVMESYQFELNDFPERLLKLFYDVPFVEAGLVADARAKAEKFATAMLTLRQTLALPDPAAWSAEIEEHRHRQGG